MASPGVRRRSGSLALVGRRFPDPLRCPEAEFQKAVAQGLAQAGRWAKRAWWLSDADALESVMFGAICEAHADFRTGAASFATYAYRQVERELSHECRRQRPAGMTMQQYERWVRGEIEFPHAACRPLALDTLADAESGDTCGDHVADPRPSPEAQVLRDEQLDALRVAIGRLSSDEQAALQLRFFEGVSPERAAKRLRLPLPTYQALEAAALAALRTMLGEDFAA